MAISEGSLIKCATRLKNCELKHHVMDENVARLIAARLSEQVNSDLFRITAHEHQEMAEESISLDDVVDALRAAKIVENYPDHKRGACCLVVGWTRNNRAIHVVCTTSLDMAVIITVYEPKPPKWNTPCKRRN